MSGPDSSAAASPLAATNSKWLYSWTDELRNSHTETQDRPGQMSCSHSQGKAQSAMLRRAEGAEGQHPFTFCSYLLFLVAKSCPTLVNPGIATFQLTLTYPFKIGKSVFRFNCAELSSV